MTTKVAIDLLPTGVPGFDDVLGGGIPEYSFNLIAGEPGSGKTTLAHQMMFALASPERPALYLTVLGEPPLKMLRYQQQFRFFGTNLSERAIRFVNLADDIAAGDLNEVLARIEAEVRTYAPRLVFVDSFRSVVKSIAPGAESNLALHQFMQRLAMLMTSWRATTFLIGEYFADIDSNPVFTIADGLVWLHQTMERNSMVRQIEIKKMRGQASMPGLHSFRIGDSGVEVYATRRVTKSQGSVHGPKSGAHRVSMGVPKLDEMLGGGLPGGHSLLVAGPSGSGKTVLAMAFLTEGARNGEAGVFAAFEQQQRAWTPNKEIEDLVTTGRVALLEADSPDLSTDEVLTLLLREIRRLDASRVVIDSLSGFELAIAPSFRKDFRESLLTFMKVLKAEGVTVVVTSELEDRYTDLRFSPYDTAFLTDAIIVQRYIEVESRLRRVLAVVKVRASHHSDELREYRIDHQGVVIGEMLVEQEGLLGGRPTRKK